MLECFYSWSIMTNTVIVHSNQKKVTMNSTPTTPARSEKSFKDAVSNVLAALPFAEKLLIEHMYYKPEERPLHERTTADSSQLLSSAFRNLRAEPE
jgi:hypothetical protein